MNKKIAGFLYKSKKYYHIWAQGFSYRSLFSKCIVVCKSQFRYYLSLQKTSEDFVEFSWKQN